MRRILLTALAVAVLVGLALVASAGGSGSGGTYEVRAFFDNGGFIVNGEDVRIAGANVGSVKTVDVSMPGEINTCHGPKTDVSQCNGGRGAAIPGKAVVVLGITDPGFRDFRTDASCLIRPQSLIGEKFVDCQATQQRAPGTPPPPELKQIPSGQIGAGQHLLPVESNGKAVDLDLINNISRQPYADRFRLILNDLGAGLAARGDDLNQIVLRADPALRETNKVLAILAAQNQQLAKLAQDADTSLEPLARERTHLTGFIRGAGDVGAATAERSADLERNLQLLPQTLREVRLTMNDLGTFSDAARPVIGELGAAAGPITRATKALSPFSEATTVALKSLGTAADASGDNIRAADPVVRQLRVTAAAAENPSKNLRKLLSTLKKTGGFEALMKFIVRSATTLNGFDKFGHYQRTNILVSGCIEYAQVLSESCAANFGQGSARGNAASRKAILALLDRATRRSGGTLAVPGLNDNGDTTGLTPGSAIGPTQDSGPTAPTAPTAPNAPPAPTGPTGATGGSGAGAQTGSPTSTRGADNVLRYLLGP